jgi:geranylgeranyl transferase type-1 subunit beta
VNKDKTIEWLLWRQQDGSGFQGRSNKPADTCYSFWVGASLEMMGAYKFVDYKENRGFLMCTQTHYGGFGKLIGSHPDVMHSYMGLASLSLMDEPDIRKMNVALNVSLKGIEHLKSRTLFWKDK